VAGAAVGAVMVALQYPSPPTWLPSLLRWPARLSAGQYEQAGDRTGPLPARPTARCAPGV